MEEFQINDPHLEPSPNQEALIENQYPDSDIEEIDVLSIGEFMERLNEIILDNIEDHLNPYNQPEPGSGQDPYQRPGFLTLFNRRKLNLGTIKRTYPEAADLADKVADEDWNVAAALFTGAFKEVKAGLNSDEDSFDNLVNTAFDNIKFRLAELTELVLFKAVKKLCSRDAIYDLLSGNLHRLDPVIGDRGCQMRAPFVLDLYQDVQSLVSNSFETEAVERALEEYETKRSEIPSFREILEDIRDAATETARIKTGRISKKGKPITKKMLIAVDGKVFKTHKKIKAFCKAIESSSEYYSDVVRDVKAYISLWKSDEIDQFNALQYLRYSKLFTCNRIRTVDEFGLPGIEIELPLPGGESFLSDYLTAVSNNSVAYMTHVCEDACRAQGLTITEDGYAVDPEDEDRIHIMGSALKLMKDGRVWTLQKSTLYQTNMCYGPTRAIFTRQALRGQPIIIDLRQLIYTPDNDVEGGYRITYNGGDILYFQPNDDGVFEYVAPDALTEEQKSSLGLICEACSVVVEGSNQPEDEDIAFCSTDYNTFKNAVLSTTIIDMIMFGLSTHPEGPSQIREGGKKRSKPLDKTAVANMFLEYNLQATSRDSMPTVDPGSWSLTNNRIPFPDGVTPEWDLLLEKASLLSALEKFGTTESFYRMVIPPARTSAERHVANMPFAPIHIYCSSYNNKIVDLEESDNYRQQNNVEFGQVLFHQDGCRPRPNQ